METLSELEGAVLGLIRERGPTTAHAVRAEFAGSPTPFFSGSVGSIYAVIRRLEDRGLLRSRAREGDGRAARDLAATAKGTRALRRWLSFEPWMAAPTPDPLRTRLLFAGALDKDDRAALLEEAEQALAAELDRGYDPAEPSEHADAACRGATALTRARLAWIRRERKNHA